MTDHPWIAVGADQSPNHAGIVVLSPAGEILDHVYVATKAGEAKRSRAHGVRFPAEILGERDDVVRGLRRLEWWAEFHFEIADRVTRHAPAVYVAIEDYAYHAAQGAHQIGEIGAVARFGWTRRAGVRLRAHDPMTVKIFATGAGNADKEAVRAAALAKWRSPEIEAFTGYGKEPGGDLIDAFVLARIGLAEAHVRAGAIALADLPDEERRIFLRVTRTNPVNLLDRPYAAGADPGVIGVSSC